MARMKKGSPAAKAWHRRMMSFQGKYRSKGKSGPKKKGGRYYVKGSVRKLNPHPGTSLVLGVNPSGHLSVTGTGARKRGGRHNPASGGGGGGGGGFRRVMPLVTVGAGMFGGIVAMEWLRHKVIKEADRTGNAPEGYPKDVDNTNLAARLGIGIFGLPMVLRAFGMWRFAPAAVLGSVLFTLYRAVFYRFGAGNEFLAKLGLATATPLPSTTAAAAAAAPAGAQQGLNGTYTDVGGRPWQYVTGRGWVPLDGWTPKTYLGAPPDPAYAQAWFGPAAATHVSPYLYGLGGWTPRTYLGAPYTEPFLPSMAGMGDAYYRQ